VGVSAGFALLSLGVETDGSIVSPASRAALYALKPTIHTVSMERVIPVSQNLDSVGGMARSPRDLAILTELLQGTTSELPDRSYVDTLNGGWEGLRMGFVDEKIWELPHFLCEPNEDALRQMVLN
jgi:amidase